MSEPTRPPWNEPEATDAAVASPATSSIADVLDELQREQREFQRVIDLVQELDKLAGEFEERLTALAGARSSAASVQEQLDRQHAELLGEMRRLEQLVEQRLPRQ